MPPEAASVELMLLAFALGVITCLAVLKAGRVLRTSKASIVYGKKPGDQARTLSGSLVGPASMGPAISAAVRSGALQLHYQPKVDCRTMKLRGAEALSRWTLPDGTLLPAEEFVAQAEAVGGISELTIWGVNQALEDFNKLENDSLGGPIFVNLSGKLITADFVSKLIGIIGSNAAKIGFEVTETAVLDNPEQALSWRPAASL